MTYTFTITNRGAGLFDITMSDGAKSKTLTQTASQVIAAAPADQARAILALAVATRSSGRWCGNGDQHSGGQRF